MYESAPNLMFFFPATEVYPAVEFGPRGFGKQVCGASKRRVSRPGDTAPAVPVKLSEAR